MFLLPSKTQNIILEGDRPIKTAAHAVNDDDDEGCRNNAVQVASFHLREVAWRVL